MPPKDLFIIAQVYRCCQYIILGDGRYKGAAPKRPDRRGQIAAMRQLCCRSCVSCRSKVILRRYKGSSKSKDREAPPQTALREGAELIFWSHGPAAESRWPRLAMSGAHRKMFLATARRETSGSPFIFTRSKNRSDSLHEVPSLPFQDL